MKVAIVHDWINGLRGGERCLSHFLKIYPEADIFTLFYEEGRSTAEIDRRVSKVSELNNLPFVRKYYRLLLPFFPKAISKFDFHGYDLVVSLSHAAAKNVVVPEGVPHISYCFTPMRYIWDQSKEYFGMLTPLLWPLIKNLRRWDIDGATRLTAIAGISNFISARIRCFYKLKSEVIYPPVDTSWIAPITHYQKGEAFIYAGALVPYKKPDLIVRAFNQLGVPLWIVGSGPMEKSLKKIANQNIRFFGRVNDTELASLFARSRALIFPGTEDFGMIPIEYMASGRPVIGVYDGALKETLNGITHWNLKENNSTLAVGEASGVFIRKALERSELEELLESVGYFMRHEEQFRPEVAVRQARLFSPERFYAKWQKLLADNQLCLEDAHNA